MQKLLYISAFYILFGVNMLICCGHSDSSKTALPKIIELNKFYDGKGVIFSKDVYYSKDMIGVTWFAPTISDIIEAESLLKDSINKCFTDDSLKRQNISQKLRKCNRQYVGYINKNDHKIIVLRTLNFSNQESRDQFEDLRWDKLLMFSTSDFYARNVRFFLINITEKKFEKGSSSPCDF